MLIEICPLQPHHTEHLVALHTTADPSYSAYFIPFPMTLPSLMNILAESKQDKYFGIFNDKEIAGFYMLRGFDQGYAVPSYGVWIAPGFSGQGLALQSLNHAVSTCTALQCSELLLKVHPNNLRAKNIYEKFGFIYVGIDLRNNNLIYKLQINSQSSE